MVSRMHSAPCGESLWRSTCRFQLARSDDDRRNCQPANRIPGGSFGQWSEQSGKHILLLRPIVSGSWVFLRLIDPLSLEWVRPVPYRAAPFETTKEGQCRVRLMSPEPHARRAAICNTAGRAGSKDDWPGRSEKAAHSAIAGDVQRKSIAGEQVDGHDQGLIARAKAAAG